MAPTIANTGSSTATDACSGVANISFVDAFGSPNCTGRDTILRTWTAIDGCGNRASCVQTISFKDTIAPVITCPTNIILECSLPTTTNNTGVATAIDNGSGVASISFVDSLGATNCTGKSAILRRWTATDGCGNSASCVQTITLQDTIAPTILCQSDRSFAAGDIWSFSEPVASDNCGVVSVQALSTVTNLNAQGASIVTRTWLAVDGCGNSNTCQQTITVAAAAPPILAIQWGSSGKVIVSWPVDATGFQLEATDGLTGLWTPVDVLPLTVTGFNIVEFTPTFHQAFYRLRKP
jgi:hypothetical protein